MVFPLLLVSLLLPPAVAPDGAFPEPAVAPHAALPEPAVAPSAALPEPAVAQDGALPEPAVAQRASVVAEYAARLAGAERDAARDELRLLGRDAAPILLALLDAEAEAVAWDAVVLFGEIGADAKGVTKKLTERVEDVKRPVARRGLAALALGAVAGSNSAKDLMDVLRTQPEPELSLAARVALANLGLAATTRAVQLMTDGESVFVRQWGAQVLHALGEDAYGARRELLRELAAPESYYLYATVDATLERLGERVERDLAEARDGRREVLAQQMGIWPLPPAYATPNEKLIDFLRGKGAGGMANEPVPVERMPRVADMSLPDRFEDVNGDRAHSVGEVVMVWSRHLASEVERLRDALYVDHGLSARDAARAAFAPVVASCTGQECLLPNGGRFAEKR